MPQWVHFSRFSQLFPKPRAEASDGAMQHLTEKEREKKNEVSEGCEEGETGKSHQQSLPPAVSTQLQSRLWSGRQGQSMESNSRCLCVLAVIEGFNKSGRHHQSCWFCARLERSGRKMHWYKHFRCFCLPVSPMMLFVSFPHPWRTRAWDSRASNLLWAQRAKWGGARRPSKQRYLVWSNLLTRCCCSLCHWWWWFSASDNSGEHEHDTHGHKSSHEHGGMKEEEYQGIFLYSGVAAADLNNRKPLTDGA